MRTTRCRLVLAGLLAASALLALPPPSLAQLPPPACGIVTTSAILTTDCLAPLTVAADEVTVDLAGHAVLCQGPGTGVDVSQRRNVRIQNGGVHDCTVSVLLSRGGGHTVRRLEISTGPGGGVMIDESDDNVLRHVRVVSARGFGIRVSGRGNRVEATELAGILSQGGAAIHLLEGAIDTRVLLNDVHNNAVGIQVSGSGNLLEANDAAHNQIGINVDGRGNTIRGNVADDNGLAGITVGAAGTDNHVQANRAHGNGIYDLADFPAGLCTLNTWKADRGETLLDGCETGRK